MVIMWANSDGSVTMSQRLAPGLVEPSVVSNPPRVASAQSALSVTSGTKQQYVFDIPANSDTQQTLIWAFSAAKPTSAATDARIAMHVDQGRLTLDLTKTGSAGGSSGGGGSTAGGGSGGGSGTSPSSYEKVFLAHAVIATVGFLVVLPIGALIPRYLRTFTTGWLKFHWGAQFVLGGLTVIIGVVLGIVGVSQSNGSHLSTHHKSVGVFLLAVWALQVALGVVIHSFKPKSAARRRPAQNYAHAIIGIGIIGLSLYQVRTGYQTAWPSVTGNVVGNGVNILWYIWAALLPAAYAAGLVLLPKQLRQEKKARQGTGQRIEFAPRPSRLTPHQSMETDQSALIQLHTNNSEDFEHHTDKRAPS
jgi:hypothetical protein